MSDTFTAKTGRTVAIKSRSMTGTILEISGLGTRTTVDLGDVATLREFFQHERDKELGRWRWPEGTDLVVYPLEVAAHTDAAYRECVVVDEATGSRQEFGSDLPQCHGGPFREAARAFFAAHPEPKPWHQAKLGEVWAVTWDGGESACRVVENEISSNGLVFDDTTRETPGTLAPVITDARRIWPEVKP